MNVEKFTKSALDCLWQAVEELKEYEKMVLEKKRRRSKYRRTGERYSRLVKFRKAQHPPKEMMIFCA
jgi:Mg2+ and Co2+ transporter CorA